MRNDTRFAKQWPSVAGVDMRVLALLIAGFWFGTALYLAAALQVGIWLCSNRQMTGMMVVRWVASLVIGRVIYNTQIGNYREWYRNLAIAPVALMAVVGFALPGQASADYLLIDSVSAQSGPLAYQIAFGTDSEVQGGCEGCSLEDVVDLVVPDRYRLIMDQGLSRKDTTVTFHSPITWGEVLRTAAERNDLLVEIMARRDVILVSQSSQGAGRLAIVDEGDSRGDLVGYRSQDNAWSLEVGKSVKENLEVWAHRVGWDLAWDIDENYQVEFPAEFNGDITEAIRTLLFAYQSQGVLMNTTLDARHDNQTFVIRPSREATQ